MKAVAVALVLVVGAAVVLWYGNTSNSWVLGGLIGGLAALLLSIPISLTLFSYLSRRHDERLRTEARQEDLAMRQVYDYSAMPARMPRKVYDVEGYAVGSPRNEMIAPQIEEHRRQATGRNLPVPAAPSSLEKLRQTQTRGQYNQRGMYTPGTMQKELAPERRAPKQVKHPNIPGYHPTSPLGQHRSAALRAARREAFQQYEDEDGIETTLPTSVSRRPYPQTSQHLPAQNTQSSRALPAYDSGQSPQRSRMRRTVDSTTSHASSRRSLPMPNKRYDEEADWQEDEPETEHLGYPQVDARQVPGTRRYSHTGSMSRQPHVEAQTHDPEVMTGTLKNPLVRRAPYTYEDDPIRQELAQQLERPITRRSSLYETDDEQEDYEEY